jgi:hypothetical protein
VTASASESEKGPRQVQTSSTASIFDLKNGFTSALNSGFNGLTGGSFGGLDNNLGSSLGGGLGAIGAGLALTLAKAASGMSRGDDSTVYKPRTQAELTESFGSMDELKARVSDIIPQKGAGRIARFFLDFAGGQDQIDDFKNQYGGGGGQECDSTILE